MQGSKCTDEGATFNERILSAMQGIAICNETYALLVLANIVSEKSKEKFYDQRNDGIPIEPAFVNEFVGKEMEFLDELRRIDTELHEPSQQIANEEHGNVYENILQIMTQFQKSMEEMGKNLKSQPQEYGQSLAQLGSSIYIMAKERLDLNSMAKLADNEDEREKGNDNSQSNSSEEDILEDTHDVVIRTNHELKRIFKKLNGTNDVQVSPCEPFLYDVNKEWNAEALEIFPDRALRPSAENLKSPLLIAKGAVQASLSREAVTWLNRINLTKLISHFNNGSRAVDEMLMSTLQIADEWQMPGRFTKQCLISGFSYHGITRMVHWRNSDKECKAGFLRHSVCVLGTEDLPSIRNYRHILVNKMMPSFDYGAIACIAELLFNRTYLAQNDQPLNMSYYENLPTVRFHNSLNNKNFSSHC